MFLQNSYIGRSLAFLAVFATASTLLFQGCDSDNEPIDSDCGTEGGCVSNTFGGLTFVSGIINGNIQTNVIDESEILYTVEWIAQGGGVSVRISDSEGDQMDSFRFVSSLPSLEEANNTVAALVFINSSGTLALDEARNSSLYRSFLTEGRNQAGCDDLPFDGDCVFGSCCDTHDVCISTKCSGPNGNVLACGFQQKNLEECIEEGGSESQCLAEFPPCTEDCTECHREAIACIFDAEEYDGPPRSPSACCERGDCGEDEQCILDDTVETDPCVCEASGTSPADPCEENPDEPPPGNSNGDVHIRTPDGLAYDFQGAGEFLLMASSDGSVVVQSRQEPWRGSDRVTINTATAMNVAGDRVGVYLARSPQLYINGTPTPFNGERIDLPNGGAVLDADPGFLIRWPSGFLASARPRRSFMDIGVAKPEGSTLAYAGLLGNMNGNPSDDIFTRSGMQMTRPIEFDDLYDVFGASWQITQTESLFDYEGGASVATYAMPDFPERPLTVNDLDPDVYAAARAQCEAAGITNPVLLDDCILDIAVTGESDFLASAQDVEDPSETPEIDFPIYFDGWGAEDVSTSNGNWEVASDGRSVFQTVNSNGPAFFISPGEYSNVEISGRFIVETGSDDDFIGFVVGYTSPIAANGGNPDEFDFVLFDWKQRSQTSNSGEFAEEGFTLTRVDGLIEPEGGFYGPFWDHDDPDMDVLATLYGDDQGWDDRTEYQFRAVYTSSRLTIYVNERLIFDVTGSFPAGRFGFYGFSQRSVRYYDFEATSLQGSGGRFF